MSVFCVMWFVSGGLTVLQAACGGDDEAGGESGDRDEEISGDSGQH